MSKKSRRRNKKLLAMLALAGGAALAGRGKGTPLGIPGGGVDAIVRRKAKRDEAIDLGIASAEADKGSDMLPDRPKKKIDFGTAYQSSRAAGNYPGNVIAPKKVNNVLVKGRINANDPRGKIQFHPSQGNVRPTMEQVMAGYDTRGWKKGGSVTGIAKRGFGRALRKGKK